MKQKLLTKLSNLTAILIVLVFLSCFQTLRVSGLSMYPTLDNNQMILINKLDHNYKPGDIVCIKNTLDQPIIKRIVATEDQIVNFDPIEKELLVDNKIIPGEYYSLPNHQTHLDYPPEYTMKFPQTVPKNHVFVLGDNREDSYDSRFHEIGMIPIENIVGHVIY